jgi:CRP-like cAMP-binding protein
MSCESIEHLIPMKKIEVLRRVSLERSWTIAENKELSALLKNSDFFKSLFGDLKSDQFTNIASHLNEGRFSDSEIIYQNNQKADRYFIILEGEVQYYHIYSLST